MGEIHFTDNSIQVKEALENAALNFLEEAAGEIEAQTKRNSRIKTGQTKGSWNHAVDEVALEATVGSSLENAIWEELGTGEHALNGDGRKGGWFYKDQWGKGHFTMGKKPNRALWKAFSTLKSKIISRAETIFKGVN